MANIAQRGSYGANVGDMTGYGGYPGDMLNNMGGHTGALTDLDAFDFGLGQRPGTADSAYASALGSISPEQKLLLLNGNFAPKVSSSSALAMPDLTNAQQGFAFQASNTFGLSNLPIEDTNGLHEFSGNPDGNGNFYAQSQAEDNETIEVEKPKAKRTRKKKITSPEEVNKKQAAFLERNRIAAKKCRAKRKIQQDNISEKVLVIGHINTSLKQSLSEWQAIRDGLLAEILAIKHLPGVQEELIAIQSGQSTLEPAFFWHHEHGMMPISEMPVGYQLPVLEDPYFEQLDAPSPTPSAASCAPPRKRKAFEAPTRRQPKRINTTFDQNDEQNSHDSSPMTGVSNNFSPMTRASSNSSVADVPNSIKSGRESSFGNGLDADYPIFGNEAIAPYSLDSPQVMMPYGSIDPALFNDAEIMNPGYGYFEDANPEARPEFDMDTSGFLLDNDEEQVGVWT